MSRAESNAVPHMFRNGMYATTEYVDTQEGLDEYVETMQLLDADVFYDDDFDELSDDEPEQPPREIRLETAEITLMGILKASIALNDNENLRWTKTGFDLTQLLYEIGGPLIEIAGPTEQAYQILDDAVLPRPVTVFNKSNKLEVTDYVCRDDAATNTHFERFATKGIDVLADVRALPIADQTVGAVFVSCLDKKDAHGDLRLDAMVGIARVLQPGGLLVWKGSTYEDIVRADMSGLEVAAVLLSDCDLEEIIFQKPAA